MKTMSETLVDVLDNHPNLIGDALSLADSCVELEEAVSEELLLALENDRGISDLIQKFDDEMIQFVA